MRCFYKLHSTASNLENTLENLQDFGDICPCGIWTKIDPCFFLDSSFYNLGNSLVCYMDIGEIFPIFHKDVILRLIFFDEIGLKHQCFQFVSRLYDLYIVNLSNHRTFRKIESFFITPIRIDSRVEIDRFSYIYGDSFFIFHTIHSRGRGESGDYLRDMQRSIHGMIFLL